MTLEKFRTLVVEQGTDDGYVDVPRCKELLRHERNRTLDEVIEKFKTWSIDDPPFAYPTFLKELSSLKVDL